MFCTSCGAENHEQARYCFKCGRLIRVPSGAKASSPSTTSSLPEASEATPRKSPERLPAAATDGSPKADPRSASLPPLDDLEPPVLFGRTVPVPPTTWFVTHWRGELSLATSFWINGIAIYAGVFLLLVFLGRVGRPLENPYWLLAVFMGVWSLVMVPSTWFWVGVWRSATRTSRSIGRSIWPTAVKCVLVIGALYTVGFFLKQAIAVAEIVILTIIASNYTVTPLQNGSEIEISGAIGPGISDALLLRLRDHPDTRVVHLNSSGGLDSEAKKLRDLIHERHLVTYTSTECVSACTIAFLGGEARLLKLGATLGFHQARMPLRQGSAFEEELRKDEEYLVALGVTREFAHRAMTTPSGTVWKPTPAELLRAHVITGTVP